MRLKPKLLLAAENGEIYDEPSLLMLVSKGGKWVLPEKDELVPLPDESELFLLPGRQAAGHDPASGKTRLVDAFAVAGFAAPGYTLSGHPAYMSKNGAEALPYFAYGAVGYANGKIWISATRVDADRRQVFTNIPEQKIERCGHELLDKYPGNRLVEHIINKCARVYACPAARNFVLGRYEAPLPSSRSCNASCVGCISKAQPGAPSAATPQCRLSFTPAPEELAQVMRIHASRETRRPIFSFGQGCEGDPLVNASLLAESIRIFRSDKQYSGNGTINCNTNASRPEAVALLANAGLSSLRISLNSAQPDIYNAYYRPEDYDFAAVEESSRVARRAGLFVSLNLLFFPGITDTLEELKALAAFCSKNGVSMIQWRNLNIDPLWYYNHMTETVGAERFGICLGLKNFMHELKRLCPWLRYGYFNPWLGAKPQISAPMPAWAS